ncbi:MAG: response regulator transcription factor [Alphaproteobacteria bacterium]|nr:response regulator transcription factor [Alphaproteobacteria bacterium]MBV9017127.1 response regulator transcription factor [Alphaproteobacteria bacterium]MBV9153331.1 response regulator transcription factor [Alphaproteobacteria bacterium]MBV9587832.1 response regulator transcription factor [Alphaproteobacteria bacterium]
MRVLVVEDDVVTAARIEAVLQGEDFICDLAHRGLDGIKYAKEHAYDIILLDLMLPDMDGYDVLQQLREAQVETPVLILSGLSELDDKLKGLSFGADDFLTKPFEHRELIARIRAIVRRSKGLSQSTIRTGRLAINLDNRTVAVGDQPVRLTSKEYALLELLSLRKGAMLSKEVLLDHLYGDEEEAELKLRVFVHKLRKKLAEASGGEDYIETVRGLGYSLREPVEPAPEAQGA